MAKAPAHPLDKLFKASLRTISMHKFQEEAKTLSQVPQPWRWPDPKTGHEWTLMGRKGELLWRASDAHSVKNHSVALHAIQEAIKHGECWHESQPGTPDILLFWLATMRYTTPHTRTQNLIARGLRPKPAGLGEPGDGGFLDQTIGLVEAECAGPITPERRRLLHETVARPWLQGCLLRGIAPGSSDWRPVSNDSLPLTWPLATVRRVFALAQSTHTPGRSVLASERDGQVLRELLWPFPPDPTMMDMLVGDAMQAASNGLPLGPLVVIERYHSQGLALPPAFAAAFSQHMTDPGMLKFPHIHSSLQRFSLDRETPAPVISRTSPRL